MDEHPRDAAPDEPARARPDVGDGGRREHWSPLNTRNAHLSWGLMAIFTAIYFIVAVLTSAEFADLAATMVLGLPLGFWLGIGMIIAGLVITRIYLARVER